MNKIKFIRHMYIFSISILFTLMVMPIYLSKSTYAATDEGFAVPVQILIVRITKLKPYRFSC